MIKLLLLLLPIVVTLPLLAQSDPDQLLDFCIPDSGPNPIKLTHLHTYPCKDPLNVTGADFTFSGVKGFATPLNFPALHAQGMSFARGDLPPGAVNPPHYHPRATETALVASGRVYAGFVGSDGRLYEQIAEAGDVLLKPKGLIHFMMNVGDVEATVFGFFNSENPGMVFVGDAVFGSGVREEVLEKSFGLSEEEIRRLRERFGGGGGVRVKGAVVVTDF